MCGANKLRDGFSDDDGWRDEILGPNAAGRKVAMGRAGGPGGVRDRFFGRAVPNQASGKPLAPAVLSARPKISAH